MPNRAREFQINKLLKTTKIPIYLSETLGAVDNSAALSSLSAAKDQFNIYARSVWVLGVAAFNEQEI